MANSGRRGPIPAGGDRNPVRVWAGEELAMGSRSSGDGEQELATGADLGRTDPGRIEDLATGGQPATKTGPRRSRRRRRADRGGADQQFTKTGGSSTGSRRIHEDGRIEHGIEADRARDPAAGADRGPVVGAKRIEDKAAAAAGRGGRRPGRATAAAARRGANLALIPC
jgi:hypothetical protein